MNPSKAPRAPIGWSYTYYGYSNSVPEMWTASERWNLVFWPQSWAPAMTSTNIWTNQPAAIVPAPAKAPVPPKPSIPDVSSIYNWYIDQFSNTNPSTANLLKTQYNWYDAFSKSANNLTNLYNNFYDTANPYYTNFARINQSLNKDIVWKLQWWLDTAYNQYWPQWEQTKRVADYYAQMASNIAAQNAVNLWTADAAARASWVNAWAVRNATQKINLDANTQFLNMKQKEIENYDNIYKNLNAYIDNFNAKYANSQDKYVRDTYNQLVNYQTQIAQAYRDSLSQIEQARLQKQLQDQAQAQWVANQIALMNASRR